MLIRFGVATLMAGYGGRLAALPPAEARRHLKMTCLSFARSVQSMRTCLLSGKAALRTYDRNGEGFRVPSRVRKPLMQEPAVGIL
jgi:hypothetical protein